MNIRDLKGWMHGEECLVVGCGPSAPRARCAYKDYWTISCNEAVEWSDPDFAVCVEPFRDRTQWARMRRAPVQIVFSHICEDRRGRRPHPRIVQIGSKNVIEWLMPQYREDLDPLTLGQSTFFAGAVAIHLGFSKVGLIGVDLTEDRWPDVSTHNRAWSRLESLAIGLGTKLVNLNEESRLECLEFGHWMDMAPKPDLREVAS